MINNKLVLYFDLDETLISVKLNQEDESKLSTSADEDLCDESEWTLKHRVVQNYGAGGDQYAFEIKAFAREEFKKVFQRIQRINRDTLNVIPCILTNASYEDRFIIPCLKKFYETQINFVDFQNIYLNNGKGTALHRGTSKGQHMHMNYENIFKWHGFQKKNIYLIDDSYINCHDAEMHGFKAIRMPCNVANRPPGVSYAKEKEKIFKHLHALLDTVEIKDQASDFHSCVPGP